VLRCGQSRFFRDCSSFTNSRARTADIVNIDGKDRQFLAYRRRLQPLCQLAFSLR
jgi:hypothetical protein